MKGRVSSHGTEHGNGQGQKSSFRGRKAKCQRRVQQQAYIIMARWTILFLLRYARSVYF